MKTIFTLLVLSLTIVSCQPEGRIYSDNQGLSPNLEWLKKDVRSFDVVIEDNSVEYDLSLAFRYATGFQYQLAKVEVTEESPSGIIRVMEFDLKVREDNGDYIGDAGLDIWDSEHKVESGIKYMEKGNYTYSITHNMENDPLHFAMEIGLIVDKAK